VFWLRKTGLQTLSEDSSFLLLLAYQRIRGFAFMRYINPRLTLTYKSNLVLGTLSTIIRDCNPGLEFSIPGFGIIEFPIPGSRDPVGIGVV